MFISSTHASRLRCHPSGKYRKSLRPGVDHVGTKTPSEQRGIAIPPLGSKRDSLGFPMIIGECLVPDNPMQIAVATSRQWPMSWFEEPSLIVAALDLVACICDSCSLCKLGYTGAPPNAIVMICARRRARTLPEWNDESLQTDNPPTKPQSGLGPTPAAADSHPQYASRMAELDVSTADWRASCERPRLDRSPSELYRAAHGPILDWHQRGNAMQRLLSTSFRTFSKSHSGKGDGSVS